MRFIFGPTLIVIGILLMKYAVAITEYFGKVDFAERYLRNGFTAGTYTLWRIVGVAICLFGGLWLLA